MDETKKEFTKADIEPHFSASDKVKVVFEKKDGTIRTMICTRNTDLIPETQRKEHGAPSAKPTPDHLFPVYDLESKGWRSFTIGKVLSVDPV